jgi:hypothetical protein
MHTFCNEKTNQGISRSPIHVVLLYDNQQPSHRSD